MRLGLHVGYWGLGVSGEDQLRLAQAADEIGTATRRRVQDLYLDRKYDEAMAALPEDLIDKVALCGPREAIADRLDVYREAGVGALLATPVAATVEDRAQMLRELAAIAA